jgi:hypothetical protein
MRWLNRWGIEGTGLEERSRLIGLGQDVLSNASTILIYLGFIALLVMFGLREVDAMSKKSVGSLAKVNAARSPKLSMRLPNEFRVIH